MLILVCLTKFFVLFLIKVCRQSRKTFLFLFCFLLLRPADKVGRPFCFCSVSYYFFILSFFSLPPSASLDFSLITQPISMKFGMLIVLDATKRCLKFQVNRTRGRDRACSQSLLCFIIGNTLYILYVEIRISLSEENFNEG